MPTPTNTAGKGASERNCEMCTGAGIIRMLTTKEITSGTVAGGEPDDKPDAQTIGGIDGQLRRIDVAVRRNTRRQAVWHGSASSEQDYDETMRWMRAVPAGTAFAVYASGPIVGEGVAQVGRRRDGFRVQGALDLTGGALAAPTIMNRDANRSHFLTGFYNGAQLFFADYQTDTAGGPGVTVGDVPMLGIRARGGRVKAGDPGAFKDTTRFAVLAYSPINWSRQGGPAIGQHRR